MAVGRGRLRRRSLIAISSISVFGLDGCDCRVIGFIVFCNVKCGISVNGFSSWSGLVWENMFEGDG